MKKSTILKIASVPAILAVGVLAMSALGSTERQSNRRTSQPEARAVQTERLSFGELTLHVDGDGVVESERTLEMISEASGRVLFAKNDLKDGTFVREGELVLKIDSRDVENDLYALRSDFLNAVASVLPDLQLDDARIYRRWFDYFKSLDINTPVPELPEITNAQEKIKVSTKNVIGLYYSVRNQEIALSKHTIRAPFDGYIGSNGVIEGSFVSTGQHLFTLVDPKNVVVTVPLLIEESQTIDFSSAPQVKIHADEGSDRTLSGRVTRKQTKLDRNSQTLDVFVTFTNNRLDPQFLPGSYVHVKIEGRTLRDVAPVPRHLIDADSRIYTMEDGSLGRQQVDVVAYQGDMAIVKNTIPEGTVLVTTVLQKPLVGMDIRSINMPELNPETELTEGGEASSELADQDAEEKSAAASTR
ncbi:MAG: efflux RND transporter periplasmic adaptor subunit [Gemmatimonadetes bacterium]|uniref:Efflux RND transporter periplasmic adaptor subunit n=1 Tax=Candidatus Kutchimonas denitrificans TaxID=3056748 RepID=A0AAE5CAP5_9BACT|nr:efflux RND transporter periplasmic adaptor subunit [Gemmatimonadota bacterium]NIR73545.1 efflux RND transporter periplasmic adaptor subunit [Candidatus Kutchimonas denitrificans]NIR99504.1 efflux RND transporter periplasmic adaptor subunit [Gemmatimonadota bacterium]NIT65124.1 efflux RND transporter periplasmic adaptor subunit [Gemmatimonadota bacterium]NIV23657.1 efflux RND transporter periplasmic adaptor subunit [Gemmatimonadota bacterium]